MSPTATTLMSISNAGERNWRPLAWAGAWLTPLLLGPLWISAFSDGTSSAPQIVTTLTGFVVVLTALAASYTDARWQLIPNWVTYSAALWGLGINAYAHSVPEAARSLGAVGLGASVAGLLLLFTLLLVVFSFTGGGAGVVKLAGAMGALIGFELGVTALLYAFVAAGISIGIWALGSIGPVAVARLLARRFGGHFFPAWMGSTTEQDRKLLTAQIPLGPFFAIGMLTVVTGFDRTIERLVTGG